LYSWRYRPFRKPTDGKKVGETGKKNTKDKEKGGRILRIISLKGSLKEAEKSGKRREVLQTKSLWARMKDTGRAHHKGIFKP